MGSTTKHWLSSNRHHLRVSSATLRFTAKLADVCSQALPERIARQTWIRYQIDIASYAGKTPAVPLMPITESFIDSLHRHPWRRQAQVATAIRLWEHRLRSGYLWLQDGRPLCFQWLFNRDDHQRLRQLPEWAGMYPPLAEGCGQVENLLTLPAGLRYPGGAARSFAAGMYALAASQGLRRLITHIHERNGAAHNWARRTGWSACGRIQRYQLDAPLLRRHRLHIHDAHCRTSARENTADSSAEPGTTGRSSDESQA